MIVFVCDRCGAEERENDNLARMPVRWFTVTVGHGGEDTMSVFCSPACAGRALELMAPEIATHRCDSDDEPHAATLPKGN